MHLDVVLSFSKTISKSIRSNQFWAFVHSFSYSVYCLPLKLIKQWNINLVLYNTYAWLCVSVLYNTQFCFSLSLIYVFNCVFLYNIKKVDVLELWQNWSMSKDLLSISFLQPQEKIIAISLIGCVLCCVCVCMCMCIAEQIQTFTYMTNSSILYFYLPLPQHPSPLSSWWGSVLISMKLCIAVLYMQHIPIGTYIHR